MFGLVLKFATRFSTNPDPIPIGDLQSGNRPAMSGAFCRPGKVAEGTKKLGLVDVVLSSPGGGTSSPFLVGSWRGRRPGM